jgi:O-antigen/teichoic acid export membrane protein
VLHRLAHPAFAATGMRLMTLPASIVCGLLGAHLTISTLGPTLFGVASLVLTLQLVFTFLDLGTGAAVLNEAARFRVDGDHTALLRTWTSSRRVAQRACLLLLAVSAALMLVDGWPRLLGVSGAGHVSLAVTVVALLNVVGRPALLALAALQGFGHSVAVVLLQVLVPVVSLAVIAMGAALNASVVVFAASLACGQLACGLGALAMVSRRYHLPMLPQRVSSTGAQRDEIRRQAGPMLVINLVAPLGMGLDRVALAHMSSPLALSTYALLAQLLQPVFTLSSTLTQSLWGDFSRKRHEGALHWDTLRSPLALVAVAALGCGVGFSVATPWVGHLLAGDRIPLGYGLSALAGCVVALTLIQTIPGALLTSTAGLSAQAKVLVGSVALNLAVTWGLASAWGVAAALSGSIAGLVVQCVILAWLSRRHLRESHAKEPTR